MWIVKAAVWLYCAILAVMLLSFLVGILLAMPVGWALLMILVAYGIRQMTRRYVIVRR